MDEKPSNVKKLIVLWFIASITLIVGGIRSLLLLFDSWTSYTGATSGAEILAIAFYCSLGIIILVIFLGCFLLFIFKKVYQGKKQERVPGIWISYIFIPLFAFLIVWAIGVVIYNSIKSMNFEFFGAVVILLLSNIGILYYSTRSDVKTYFIKSEQEKRHCPFCGRSIPFNAKKCPYCIKKFE